MPAKELTVAEAREYAARYPDQVAGPICEAGVSFPLASPARTYVCTRPAGHDGPHVAHAPSGPVATWSD